MIRAGGVALGGDVSLGSLQTGGDAGFALAILVGLGPGQVAGFGGRGDFAGVLDQGGSFLDFGCGLGGFGLDCGWLGLGGLLAGFLAFAEAAARLSRIPG